MTEQSKPIIQPEKGWEMGFASGKDNPIGLKFDLQWDGKIGRGEFTPNEFHQGWGDIVHGGIIECLLDEAMAWTAWYEGMNVATATIQVRFRRPVKIGETLVITASIIRKRKTLVEAKANMTLKDGTPVAEAKSAMIFISPGQEGETHQSDADK